ncbi:MAG: hypothetical protein ACHQ17_09850 [Polyangia bacterium]
MNRQLLFALACATLFGGCQRSAITVPTSPPGEWHQIDLNQARKVDILFMVDNSPGTVAKQNQLKAQFPQLIKILDDFGKMNPAWYHLGVVTSDLGAGQFTIGGGECHPGGDGGQLQAIGAAAQAGCLAPTGGVNFIDYNQLEPDASGNPSSNLPPGQDLSTTFDCMASVGSAGCGFEMPLESVYAALHNPPPANHDFLRPDALLAVMWLTDEDDCSAPPDTDLFDAAHTEYGPLLSYRCTRYGVECGNPPALMPEGDSGGPLSGCQSAPNPNGMGPGKLYDISRYINFFSKPASQGGIKTDPNDVILLDISAPDMPVASLLVDPNAKPPGPYMQCPADMADSCTVVLQHSCIAPTDDAFFGDPAVRLRQVVRSVKSNQSTSICDTSYQSALQSLGGLLTANLAADGPKSCIALADPAHPQCEVRDFTQNADGTTSVIGLPECGAGIAEPCWKIVSDSSCPTRLVIDRSTPIAPNTAVQASCLIATAS